MAGMVRGVDVSEVSWSLDALRVEDLRVNDEHEEGFVLENAPALREAAFRDLLRLGVCKRGNGGGKGMKIMIIIFAPAVPALGGRPIESHRDQLIMMMMMNFFESESVGGALRDR